MNDRPEQQRVISIIESDRIPVLDIVFGFGPTLPFVAGTFMAWWLSMFERALALQMTALWGCAILLFLSGVRRGLSFRTEDGPTLAQMVTMLALFVLGLAALVTLWIGATTLTLVILLIGYAMIFILDPIAAEHGEAPLYFKRLRRMQMPVILLSLGVAIVIALNGP